MTAARALIPPAPVSHTRAVVNPMDGLHAEPLTRRPRHEVIADLDAAITRKAAALEAARTLAQTAAQGLTASAWGNVVRELERDLEELRRVKNKAVGA